MSAARPGRPRKNAAVRLGNGTAEEIADAAAELFSSRGFAATSMNQIAEAVGVGQNSIYHHFGSKLGLLNFLLEEGIRPSLRIAELLQRDRAARPDTDGELAAARLYALAESDASVLANWRWNVGALHMLPEARHPELAEFQERRRALRAHYTALSRALTSVTGSDDIGDQVLRLVVSIINQRWDDQVTADTARQLARSALRICGWVRPIDPVADAAHELMARLRLDDTQSLEKV